MSIPLVPASLTLSPQQLVPVPGDFVHRSSLHGQAHVARVMVHAFRLLRATGLHDETHRLWASVFLHDLARTHDGRCYVHGADACARFANEPALRARIARGGVREDEHPMIVTAVSKHSRPEELERSHPHWTLTALLKDADGLDRVRLGDLDARYLRLEPSRGMVAFAQALHDRTRRLDTGADHFAQVIAIAEALDDAGAPA